jgi:hypothetical protein
VEASAAPRSLEASCLGFGLAALAVAGQQIINAFKKSEPEDLTKK